jgi:hypothetical protein
MPRFAQKLFLMFGGLVMIRARLVLAATTVALSIPAGVALFAQTPAAPDLHPILAGRAITPPFKGEAQIQVQWPPTTHRDKDNVVTTIRIKNISSGPLKGFKVDQPWYNKDGAVVASTTASVVGMFQPNEVQTLTLELPYHTGMDRNNYLFSHANGSVKKPETVAKIDAPAATAAKPATPAKK